MKLSLVRCLEQCEGFVVMLAMILVENFPTHRSEPRLHSHGPQVCDVDKEQIICVPK